MQKTEIIRLKLSNKTDNKVIKSISSLKIFFSVFIFYGIDYNWFSINKIVCVVSFCKV